MNTKIAIVAASDEGYRISLGEDPPILFPNGITLAEGYARLLVEKQKLDSKLEDVRESLRAYEALATGNNTNWETCFNGLKNDISEAVTKSPIAF